MGHESGGSIDWEVKWVLRSCGHKMFPIVISDLGRIPYISLTAPHCCD